MQVQVEVEYSATPPAEEVQAMRWAAKTLASNPNSISVRLSETRRHRPAIVLEFEMKTQAQYKVVDEIADSVHQYTGRLYSDMTVRFPKERRRAL
jgi:hypothetical protein